MAKQSNRPTATNYQDYLLDYSGVDLSRYRGQVEGSPEAAAARAYNERHPDRPIRPEEIGRGGVLSDMGHAVAAGLNELAALPFWGAQQVADRMQWDGVARLAGDAKAYFQESAEAKRKGYSADMKLAQEKEFITYDKEKGYGLGTAWSDPRAVLGSVAESLPGMAAGMGRGLSWQRGSWALGCRAALPGASAVPRVRGVFPAGRIPWGRMMPLWRCRRKACGDPRNTSSCCARCVIPRKRARRWRMTWPCVREGRPLRQQVRLPPGRGPCSAGCWGERPGRRLRGPSSRWEQPRRPRRPCKAGLRSIFLSGRYSAPTRPSSLWPVSPTRWWKGRWLVGSWGAAWVSPGIIGEERRPPSCRPRRRLAGRRQVRRRRKMPPCRTARPWRKRRRTEPLTASSLMPDAWSRASMWTCCGRTAGRCPQRTGRQRRDRRRGRKAPGRFRRLWKERTACRYGQACLTCRLCRAG